MICLDHLIDIQSIKVNKKLNISLQLNVNNNKATFSDIYKFMSARKKVINFNLLGCSNQK